MNTENIVLLGSHLCDPTSSAVQHIRAVYTRENKPRITQSMAYVSRERAFYTSRVRINGSVRGLNKLRLIFPRINHPSVYE